MKNKILIINIVLLIFVSCKNNKKEEGYETSEQYGDIYNEEKSTKQFNYDSANCNRLIIGIYSETREIENKKPSKYAPYSTEKNYELLLPKKLNELLAKSKKTGYCCCPNRNLSINFYNKTREFDTKLVDTTEYKDKVIIFDEGYQSSNIVSKTDWNNFLNETELLTSNEYFSTNLNSARKVYNYALKNNLVLKTSNKVSKNWMFFDGEFFLKVKEYGNELKAEDLVDKIKEEYKDDKFEIEVLFQKHSYSKDKSEYYDCEIEMKIYCNKDFYNKFNLYKSKSTFKKTNAEFFVLGKSETLNQIDKILRKAK